MTSTTCENA